MYHDTLNSIKTEKITLPCTLTTAKRIFDYRHLANCKQRVSSLHVPGGHTSKNILWYIGKIVVDNILLCQSFMITTGYLQ